MRKLARVAVTLIAPVNPDTLRQWLAVAISTLSLVLASVALGWNIYRDIILKARVRVSFSVVRILTPGQKVKDGVQFVRISATNHGPGPVTIDMISGQTSPLWRRLLRRPQHFVILPDYTNPLNPKLPQRLGVGDSMSLYLPYDASCLLKDPITHIGVSDSFGRLHYAPRNSLNTARRGFGRDFPVGR